jgi:hypothetical protein
MDDRVSCIYEMLGCIHTFRRIVKADMPTSHTKTQAILSFLPFHNLRKPMLAEIFSSSSQAEKVGTCRLASSHFNTIRANECYQWL